MLIQSREQWWLLAFQAGVANNAITDTAFLHGTICALTQGHEPLVQNIKTVAEGVAAALGWKSK